MQELYAMSPKEFQYCLNAHAEKQKTQLKMLGILAVMIHNPKKINHIVNVSTTQKAKSTMTKEQWAKRREEIIKEFDDFNNNPKKRVVRTIRCN